MRYAERASVAEPPSLATPSEAVKTEMDDAKAYYQTFNPLTPGAKAFSFEQYKGYDVTQSLRALFRNKCAYCESSLGDNLDVEHFRPKGGVTGEPAHGGYWWLAHSWDNLLPSCIACNQKRRQHILTEDMTAEDLARVMARKSRVSHGKANQFPISGVRATYAGGRLEDERPLLIDPSKERPEAYLRWSHDGVYSIVLAQWDDPGKRERALRTISVFALNRVWLVQSRTEVLTELRYQAAQIESELEEDMAAGGSHRHLQRALRRVEEMKRHHAHDRPYSAMAKAFVEEFAARLKRRIEGASNP